MLGEISTVPDPAVRTIQIWIILATTPSPPPVRGYSYI